MKTKKLIELKNKMDAIGDDYKHPLRSQAIEDYFKELEICGRYYFDDDLEAFAQANGGREYGEDTMLEMRTNGECWSS
jgi:hypothetical protein